MNQIITYDCDEYLWKEVPWEPKMLPRLPIMVVLMTKRSLVQDGFFDMNWNIYLQKKN